MDEPQLEQRRLVEQRIRNRIIEVLELAADFESQRRYQQTAPIAHVPNEVINQWDDWFSESVLASPVFSDDERHAARTYSKVIDEVAKATPDPLPDIETTQSLPEWSLLHDAANRALEVFQRRGRFSDELIEP